MFSPYYARARQRGAADPLQHCALNVALYGPGGKRWALTERGKDTVQRAATRLCIGPSALAWDGEALTIDIDEVTFPVPSRIRGQVRLIPSALTRHCISLDGDGVHHWTPFAPCARAEVRLTHPALRWEGRGYLDGNAGSAPLEDAFTHWHWSRASVGADTVVLYDVARRRRGAFGLAARFRPDGGMTRES